MARSPWLPLGTCPDADIRLVCLPHARAGASAFRLWGKGMDARIGVCPVQPPGREKRRKEAPFTSVEPLVRELVSEISESVAEPYALFGHSTGALCAFQTVRALRDTGGPMPVHLFVSGRRAPHMPLERDDLAAMSLPELAEFLQNLGGTPEGVLADHDILGALRPLLAADFSVNQGYDFIPAAPLDIPVTAFAGVEDTGADGGLMAPWKEQTTSDFTLHELDGGRFAVFDRATEVHAHIAAHLSTYLRPAA